MDIKNLFNGIAVIIDNEINDDNSDIAKIKKNIEKNNIPVATYCDIPDCEVIGALSHASFIVLDWDYYNDSSILEDPTERLMIPSGLKEEKQKEVTNFIKRMLEKIFVPIFIFTALNPEGVTESLKEEKILISDRPNRVFIKQKTAVSSEQELFDSMSEWLKNIPSAYVLKEWEKEVQRAKDEMFLELYRYSPNWVIIIWDMLKKDSIENEFEFGSFITKNLINRVNQYNFSEEYLKGNFSPTQKELFEIIERERYIEYSNQPEQAYTGDLFKETINGKAKYYLNVRAQCDLARDRKVELYLLTGRLLNPEDIVTEDIRITSQGDLIFGKNNAYKLDKINEICDKAQKDCDNSELIELNEKFQTHRNKIFFGHGEILEKKPEVIMACVDGGQIIKFRLDLCVKKFKDIKDKRIGRILPPYINRIQ
ncbi:MAG: hypothetical protein PHX01_07615, partial [Clostridia bacterium]|nr:hypothetical protein [Clostridia bacterium]